MPLRTTRSPIRMGIPALASRAPSSCARGGNRADSRPLIGVGSAMSSLATHSSDVRDSRPDVADRGGVNVNHVERWASILGGAAMALYGVRRRDWGGAVVALLGGALVQRGVSGHCPVYQALGLNTERGREGVLEK